MESLALLDDPISFLHTAIDRLCGRAHQDLALSAGRGVPESVKAQDLCDVCSAFFQKVVGKDFDDEQIAAELQAGGLTAELHAAVVEVVRGRQTEVKAALERHAVEISNAHLTDFDWSLRLVLASDKLSHVRKPIVLLKLFLSDASGSARRDLIVELGKAELDKLLDDCSNINTVLQSLVQR